MKNFLFNTWSIKPEDNAGNQSSLQSKNMLTDIIKHTGKLSNDIHKYAELRVDICFINFQNSGQNKWFNGLTCMLDTGAVETYINEQFLKNNGIPLNDKIEPIDRGTANGAFKSYVYQEVGLRLRPMENTETEFMRNDEIILRQLIYTAPVLSHDILIGNDVLSFCRFLYSGIDGSYCIEFPSSVIKKLV